MITHVIEQCLEHRKRSVTWVNSVNSFLYLLLILQGSKRRIPSSAPNNIFSSLYSKFPEVGVLPPRPAAG